MAWKLPGVSPYRNSAAAAARRFCSASSVSVLRPLQIRRRQATLRRHSNKNQQRRSHLSAYRDSRQNSSAQQCHHPQPPDENERRSPEATLQLLHARRTNEDQVRGEVGLLHLLHPLNVDIEDTDGASPINALHLGDRCDPYILAIHNRSTRELWAGFSEIKYVSELMLRFLLA